MAIVSEDVRYSVGDTSMHSRVFHDDSITGRRPAVMVFPEGFGVSEHTYGIASRLAELGYVGFACDMYGDGFFHNGPCPELQTLSDRLRSEPGRLRAVGTTTLDFLCARGEVDPFRIAAIGYCLGGTIAMELGFAGAPIEAIASFHPSFHGLTLADAGKLSCPMHLFMGSEDYASPPEDRAEFEAAMKGKGLRWQMVLYGSVKHSYTNPNIQGMGDRVGYDPEAAQHSWDSLVTLLQRAFT